MRIGTALGWQAPYELDAPVVAIVGPVDTGKSSMLDCIAYALGRDVRAFRGAVHTQLTDVELRVRLGTSTYTLRRSRSEHTHVTVYDAGGTLEGRFPVKAEEGRLTLSDWLLAQLGLDDAFAAVRLSGNRQLDFANALLPYCYIRQSAIDNQIIRDPRDDEERLIVARLLLNLTTPAFERRASTIREVDNQIERSRSRAGTVDKFLSASPHTNHSDLQERIATLTQQRDLAGARLAQMRNDARAADKALDSYRDELSGARKEVSAAETELDRKRLAHDRLQARMKELDQALLALAETEARAADHPPPLGLVQPACPLCKSSIAERPVLPDHCSLCTQRYPGTVDPQERQMLMTIRETVKADLAAAHGEVGTAKQRADAAHAAAKRVHDGFNQFLKEPVSPYADALAAASAAVHQIEGELAALAALEDAHRRLQHQRLDIDRLKGEQEERRREHVANEAELESARDVVNALNEIGSGDLCVAASLIVSTFKGRRG
nr:AAA family ATPase [Nonomuraea sp. K271]